METNRDLLSKLKFIARIQPSEKISLQQMKIVNDDSFTAFWRFIFRDNSRSKTLAFLDDTISKAFEVIRNYSKSSKASEVAMVQNVVEDLRNSKAGLHNIKETYSSDRKFCCDVDVLLQLIDANLIEMGEMFPDTRLTMPLMNFKATKSAPITIPEKEPDISITMPEVSRSAESIQSEGKRRGKSAVSSSPV